MPFITPTTLATSLASLWSSADHMLKIWFVLKQMGLKVGGSPVAITTSTPTEALERLFSFGDKDNKYYVPFAHKDRFATMEGDASRSIIQTNIRRWLDSGSVVTIDPTNYLNFNHGTSKEILVSCARNYPIGLGYGKNGFALDETTRVSIPIQAFAVWYGRYTEIPKGENPEEYLVKNMLHKLSIDSLERESVFISKPIEIKVQEKVLSPNQVNKEVSSFLNHEKPQQILINETFANHVRRIRSMTAQPEDPHWLRVNPLELLKETLLSSAKAILLYGPPRTSKTWAIDQFIPRESKDRVTIQIHDGWGYEDLFLSLKPKTDSASASWAWEEGALYKVIKDNKKFIVLEEINRTNFTQALGEVFSLIEAAYRGEKFSITLKNGNKFYIPEDVTIIATMNTIDKSTEDVDDALLGRFSCIQFLPNTDLLNLILEKNKIDGEIGKKLRDFFGFVQEFYPLGHGYFADFLPKTDPLKYYITKIRPVLQSHLEGYKDSNLKSIDLKIDELFNK